MQVRTLRAHDNEFGPTYHKAKGREYEITDDRLARQMIDDELIEEIADGGEGGGTSGTGSRSSGTAKGNS